MLTACSTTGLVVNAPSGSLVKGTIQVQMQDGKVKTMDNTNLFCKDEKIKAQYTVRVRGNKVVKILNKGK